MASSFLAPGYSAAARKESSSFLKKRTKKLLPLQTRASRPVRPLEAKVFASFFKKKRFLASNRR
jgi:hypothetical protein